MNTQFLVFVLLLTLVVSLLLVKKRPILSRGILLVATALLAARAFAWWKGTVEKGESAAQMLEAVPSQGRPGGYVSSDKCEACPPSQYDSWHRSYHRTMTQHATTDAVRGQFDNLTLALDGQTCHLERVGDEFWVDMEDP